MRSPVLIAPPAILPVTVEAARAHLRVDGAENDESIWGLIQAAVSHLDGRTGILGRCLVEQTWRIDFDAFSRCTRLPLWPIISIESITWRNGDGEIATIAAGNYALVTDEIGAYVLWDRAYTFPSELYESASVSVTLKAGYPNTSTVEADPGADPPVEAVAATSTVPDAIKQAILLMVGNWYRFRSANVETSVVELPMGVSALLAPFRRRRI